MVLTVARAGQAVESPRVADARATINAGIRVEHLGVEPGNRDTNFVVVSRHGREVENNDHEIVTVSPLADVAEDTVLPVVGRDPAEAFARHVLLVQSGLVLVELVQVADQLPDSVMQWLADQRPVELDVVIPFGPLRDLAPHEQQFLTGLRVLVSIEQSQVGKLLPRITGHL